MGTTTDTIALDEATVDRIRELLRDSRAGNRMPRPAWSTARLSVDRLFVEPGARSINADQLERVIFVVSGASFSGADPGLSRSYGNRRVNLWDQLLELRNS